MVSEKHVPGTEFGPLQLAMWTKQFAALRDGDRFFYANDPVLDQIQRDYGVTYKVTLSQLIKLDTGVTLQPDVFLLADTSRPCTTGCCTASSGRIRRGRTAEAVTEATIQRRGEVSEWSKERDWKSRRC